MFCDPIRWTHHYATILAENFGIQATAIDAGHLVIKINDEPFIIHNTAPHDPELLSMTALLAADDESVSDQMRLVAANRTNSKLKGARIVVGATYVAVEVQMLAAGPDCLPAADHLVRIIPRIVSMLTYGADSFLEELELVGIEIVSGAS
jgi:hypothetical protein